MEKEFEGSKVSPRNYKEWKTVDKSTWARGEWDNEPDKVQWIDPETGLDCLIIRNGSGALCGYVGVPEGHPFHSVGYDDIRINGEYVEVHGGLTFSGLCSDNSRAAWKAFRSRKAKWQEEAAKYPVGDAARRLSEWAGTFDDYDAWLKRAESVSICHISEVGRPDHVWWMGFDCAHYGDVSPAYDRGSHGDIYASLGYVVRQVTGLAKQASPLRLLPAPEVTP